MTRRAKPAAGTRTRAVAYVRVSTDKQAEHGVSLEAQEVKLRAYADLYEIDLVAVEVDAGESASTLERPALQRALRMLRRGDADALLVVKLDRLTRSVRDLADLLETYFKKRACLLSVSEQIDTRSAAGRMVLNILTTIGEWEREAIGERTAAALGHMRAQGLYTGGDAPIGYRVAGDRLEPLEAEQAVVARARALREQGLSLRAVAATLEEAGVTVRGGMSLGRVHRMLRAECVEADTLAA